MKTMRLNNSTEGPVLIASELPRPLPGEGELLISVRAAGVTPTELGWYPTTQTKDGTPRKGAVPTNGDDRAWWKEVVRRSMPEDAFGDKKAFETFFEDVYVYFGKPDAWGIYPEVLEVLAEAYAADLLPRAQADVARQIDEAKTYSDKTVAQAQGDAERFKQVYAQYSKAPAVIRERLYLETMQQIYSNTTKVYVDSKSSNNVLYLPLDKLVEQQLPASHAAFAEASRNLFFSLPVAFNARAFQ